LLNIVPNDKVLATQPAMLYVLQPVTKSFSNPAFFIYVPGCINSFECLLRRHCPPVRFVRCIGHSCTEEASISNPEPKSLIIFIYGLHLTSRVTAMLIFALHKQTRIIE